MSLLLLSCNKEDDVISELPSQRNFQMGFSTWSFGPLESDRNETYDYIQNNGGIYSEQIDDKIPWASWINDTPLPQSFLDDINYRVGKKKANLKLVLSISPLNTSRDDLIEDWNNTPISYTTLSDQIIEDAYFKHVIYLVGKFSPDYLVVSMEGNDLLKNSSAKWAEFKILMSKVRSRLKQEFPDLPISESITLHNLFNPDIDNPSTYIQEISDYVNSLDFAAISFYPFFKNQHSKSEFQEAFDFLHGQITKPIAFVETNHLAEDLIIPSFNTNITSNPSEQKDYLEVLFENANENNYHFVIWWAHRDYDALWESFPDEVKDLGQVWRDTGILDENGEERPAHDVWQTFLLK